jgi:spoIIIJ-associated protein
MAENVINETCRDAQLYLAELLEKLGFELSVASRWTDEGCTLDLTGEDSHFALMENGEMLDALEVVLFQVFGRSLEREHRFIVDAEGFREGRRAELRAMAHFAADQVRKNGRPFTFGVLNSTERRAIHMTLQPEADLVTESVGDGRDRRLQVRPK